MNRQSASIAIRGDADPHSDPATMLRGSRLVIARVVWSVITLGVLILFAATFPLYLRRLQTVCTSALCSPWQPGPQAVQAFHAIGVSLGTYMVASAILTAIYASLWLGIGLFMFWRRSRDWVVLIFSLQCVTQMVGQTSFLAILEQQPSIWQFPAQLLSLFNFLMLMLVFALFPNGRFAPRWMRWVVLIAIVLTIIVHVLPHLRVSVMLASVVYFVSAGSLIGGQIYRYRHVSTAVERQQTKVVVFSLALVLLAEIAFALPFFIFPAFGQPGSFYQIIDQEAGLLILLVLPPSIALAMLRYRLWDVDILINRALVYGTLTGTLALLYFGCVIGLQALSGNIFHQTSAVAIVLSTLVIAALFQPLKRRIQLIIDRRFYRHKYDAVRTLAAFGTVLRTEVDLNELSNQLIAVVQDTMQPAHVSLWLRQPERVNKRSVGFEPREERTK